jgi:hypothetical protein
MKYQGTLTSDQLEVKKIKREIGYFIDDKFYLESEDDSVALNQIFTLFIDNKIAQDLARKAKGKQLSDEETDLTKLTTTIASSKVSRPKEKSTSTKFGSSMTFNKRPSISNLAQSNHHQ